MRAAPSPLRSRVVRWLRVVLPLLALVLLSMLFLVARTPSPDTSIPYAQDDADALAARPGMTAPRYAGVTRDGAQLTLRAAQADPGGDGAATDLALDWQARNGVGAQIRAPRAERGDDEIALRGGVGMRLTTGWTLDAPNVDVSTTMDRIRATGGVQATAPFGTLSADEMDLRRLPDGAQVLDLNGSVRLLYQP